MTMVSTAIIGNRLAKDNIPNPSTADTALPKPSPIAKTNGTVTGPVVTPALSQPTFTNSSDEKNVSITPIAYRGIKTEARSKPLISFAIHSDIPTETPTSTLYIRIDFLKAQLVRF